MPAHSSAPRPRRRVRAALIAGSLFGSLVVNVVLCQQVTTQYRRRSEQQLDPYGLLRPGFPPAQPARHSPAAAATVVFYGDSRAQQWPAPALAACRVENRGIGGQTSAQVLGRYAQHVAPLNARVVVLQVGINDLKSIGVLPERRDEIEHNLLRNLRELVERMRAQGSKVILTTLFPIGAVPPWLWPIWSDEISAANARVNVEIRKLARESGVMLFDAFALLADGQRLRAEYGFDTLHLSERGYERLNAELSRVLAADCADERTP